jgi:hypothetical protein
MNDMSMPLGVWMRIPVFGLGLATITLEWLRLWEVDTPGVAAPPYRRTDGALACPHCAGELLD